MSTGTNDLDDLRKRLRKSKQGKNTMRGKQMNALVYVCIGMAILGIAIGIGGVFFGARMMDNDYSKLDATTKTIQGEMNAEKEKYEKGIANIAAIENRLNENLNLAITFKNKLEFVDITDVVTAARARQKAEAPPPQRLPSGKARVRAPGMNQ